MGKDNPNLNPYISRLVYIVAERKLLYISPLWRKKTPQIYLFFPNILFCIKWHGDTDSGNRSSTVIWDKKIPFYCLLPVVTNLIYFITSERGANVHPPTHVPIWWHEWGTALFPRAMCDTQIVGHGCDFTGNL